MTFVAEPFRGHFLFVAGVVDGVVLAETVKGDLDIEGFLLLVELFVLLILVVELFLRSNFSIFRPA